MLSSSTFKQESNFKKSTNMYMCELNLHASSFYILQNARCSAEQTQTVTRQSSTITVAPIQGNFLL